MNKNDPKTNPDYIPERHNENNDGLIPHEVQYQEGNEFYSELEAMNKSFTEDERRDLILHWDQHIDDRFNDIEEGQLVGHKSNDDNGEITLPFGYKPRNHQLEFWDMFNLDENGDMIIDKNRWFLKQKLKRILFIWHRRAGKDLDTWNRFLFVAAMRPGIYWYFLPTKTQARQVIFEGRDNQNRRFIDYLPRDLIDSSMFRYTETGWNKNDMSTTLKNGSVITILGSDNYDRLVGANAAGCVFSEWSLCDPVAWDYIEPMILAQDGFAWFIYTPRGRNHGYDLYKNALDDPDNWTVSHLTVEDTNWEIFNEQQIKNLRKKGTPESKIQSEYFVNFDAPVEGAFYSDQIISVYQEDRFLPFKINKGLPVKVSFDLGMSDNTTLVFFQEDNKRGLINILYYYEMSGQRIEHYINEIKAFEKRSGCEVKKIILPHDAAQREITSGKTRLQIISKMTDIPCIQLKKKPLYDGIDNVRRVLPNTVFFEDIEWKLINKEKKNHSGNKLLLNRLSTYMKKYNKKKAMFMDEPEHNINSHAADAFRYLAMHVDINKIEQGKIDIKLKGLRS